MTRYEIPIAGRVCSVFENRHGGATVFCPLGAEDDPDELAGLVLDGCGSLPFRLVCFSVSDWNAELSPWAADGVFRGQSFSGGAPVTLEWLTQEALRAFPGLHMIAGYSLAGLFALWAACETDAFCAAASSSGSLWFPGWADYAATHSLNAAAVYLSLGEREERTRDAVMAAVGDNTRALAARLGVPLVMNPGGHFTDPAKRLAAGIASILRYGLS